VTFAGDAGRPSAGVTFGADSVAGTYAKLDDDRAVFLAPAGLRARLTSPYLDRHRLVVDPYALVSIDITRKGTRRSLDPHAKDDAGILLGDDAAGLLTETVHMGPPRPGEGFDDATVVVLRLVKDAGKGDIRFSVGAAVDRAGRPMRRVRVPGVDATLAAPAGPTDALARLLGRP